MKKYDCIKALEKLDRETPVMFWDTYLYTEKARMTAYRAMKYVWCLENCDFVDNIEFFFEVQR